MQPVFFRINQAIRYTLEYYEIGKIKDHLFRLAGTERVYSTPHHLDEWYDLMFDLHQRMEDEINQTIHTTNQNTQVYLFETLKEWLNDYRIVQLNKQLILFEIDKYNDKVNAAFEDKVAKEVETFQLNPNFSRGHKEEYEVEQRNFGGLLGGFTALPGTCKVKKINYKYYCIEERPELIDTHFLEQYYPIVDSIIQNFRRIVSKYVIRYDAGKIVPNHQVIVQHMLPMQTQHTLTQPEEIKDEEDKIRWAGTPKQFVQTFYPLIKDGTLKYKGNSDTETIVRRLYNCFRIDKAKGAGELAFDSLSTYFKKENTGDTY
ncbi:MAG TPA: hypothetical protein VMR70_11420 [Flavisolibacter sp.]|nr:hypothetical protein [Flavisolibacter sp.]